MKNQSQNIQEQPFTSLMTVSNVKGEQKTMSCNIYDNGVVITEGYDLVKRTDKSFRQIDGDILNIVSFNGPVRSSESYQPTEDKQDKRPESKRKKRNSTTMKYDHIVYASDACDQQYRFKANVKDGIVTTENGFVFNENDDTFPYREGVPLYVDKIE